MDILQFLVEFFTAYGYLAVFVVLLACGFGVPIPEDITLVAGGIISGLGYTNQHTMFIVGLAGVLAGDGTMFAAGRIFGARILRFRPVAKIMTPERYQMVERQFEKYGSWVLFVARFMPGLRTPIYLTAGLTRKVSALRFLLLDGFAALISVPVWVYLGFYGAHNREWLLSSVKQGQFGLLVALGAVFLIVAIIYFVKKSKQASKER